MSELTVGIGIALKGVEHLLAAAGPRGDVAIARALNRTGSPVSTATKRQIVKTLGLKRSPYNRQSPGAVIRRNTSERKASAARLSFSLAGFGDGLPAIFYQPREAPVGASINWLGARKTIARSFYLGGKFPRRKRSRISHAVWRRTGDGRWNLDRPKGPSIPEAMRTRAVGALWESQAAARLPAHLKSALEAVLRGY